MSNRAYIMNRSADILDHLTDGLDLDMEHKKIGKKDGAFMQVHVDWLYQAPQGPVFSVAHYFEQNWDLCCDPRMTFLRWKHNGNDRAYLPVSYETALPPVYNEAMKWEAGKLKWNRKLARELATFARQWLRNIEKQQGLKIERRKMLAA